MPDRTTSKTTALVFVVAALLLNLSSAAQGRRDSGFGDLLSSEINPLQQMGRVSTATLALEGAVDAAEYLVGPGDLFDISIGGPQPVLVTLPVSADGFLMLPGSGAVRVSGRSLEEARTLAHASLREQYQNVRVEVTLSQPRQFYVHVSGAVPVPGRYLATPVARVATVLNIAFADTTQLPVSNTTLRPSLRNVRVIHRDGAAESVDVLRYFSTGNPDHNPYLRDGDVISVPTYDPNYDAVYVSGDVAFPGIYDFRPDDTLFDLLVLTTGQNPPSGFERVRLARTRSDGSVAAQIIDVLSAGKEIPLEPRDQIFVLHDETVRGTAELSGWVNFPGTYSIVPGKTTVRDLLELGGEPRPGALERGAFLERSTLPEPELDIRRQNRFEFAPRGMARLMAADTLAILKNTRLAEMDFLSRVYLAQELRLQ
ncbi:MAG: polysaccharide biosynthesis/export family protein, partial [Rhodothermales bacterium]